MGIGQQQSTNNRATRENVIQLLNILKQESLGNKIDYKEASKLMNDIVIASKDETMRLRRSKRYVPPPLLPLVVAAIAALGKEAARWISNPRNFAKVQKYSREQLVRTLDRLNKLNTEKNRESARDIAGEIVEHLDGREYNLHNKTIQETTNAEGQLGASARGVLEMLAGISPEFSAKLSEALNRPSTGEEQVTEMPLVIVGQQVTEMPLVIGGQHVTEIPQVSNGQNATIEVTPVAKVQNVTIEVPRITERQNATTQIPPVTRVQNVTTTVPPVVKGQNATTIVPPVVKAQNVTTTVPPVIKGQNATIEVPPVTRVQNATTEAPRITERQNITTTVLPVAKGQNATTEAPRITERQNITTAMPPAERYSNASVHLGIEQGDLNMIKYFVEKGADINTKNSRGDTLLHLAVKGGHLDIVEYLVEKGADVEAKDRNGNTVLHLAAENGQLDIVKYLIEKGADVNAKSKHDITPLHKTNDLNIAKLLIKSGANVNAVDGLNRTPLSLAVEDNKPEIAELLLSKGANVNINVLTIRGLIPMLHALVFYPYIYNENEEARTKMMNLLLSNRRDLVDIKNEGTTPLHWAVARGKLDIINLLLDSGANVNMRGGSDSNTPLHWAAVYQQLGALKLLIERGADINAKNRDGETPLYKALANRPEVLDLHIVEHLLQKGADVTARDRNRGTPLHYAAGNGNLDAVKLLVQNGADITMKNKNGYTPLDFARNSHHSQVVAFLSSHQHGNRGRREVSNNSWMSNSVVSWVKGFISSTESPALLTSEKHSNHTIATTPEINTLVNNTLLLGILATSSQKLPLHENLLSPIEQSMRLNDLDRAERTLREAEEKYGPSSSLDDVLVHNNETWLQK